MRASMQVMTRYFLDGGRARSPLSKLPEYLSEADFRADWLGVSLDIFSKGDDGLVGMMDGVVEFAERKSFCFFVRSYIFDDDR